MPGCKKHRLRYMKHLKGCPICKGEELGGTLKVKFKSTSEPNKLVVVGEEPKPKSKKRLNRRGVSL